MIDLTLNYSGKINVNKNYNPRILFEHQKKAIEKLNEKSKKDIYKGLLVIPTGGGKTYTAIYWVLNQIINKGKKVLWIAHRHELLNQTLNTAINTSYSDILPNRKQYSFRIISGIHDRPVNIEKTDDFIIASKDSLNHGKIYLEKWIKANKDNICLVIDEAHHASAKSYRNIISILEKESKKYLKIIGLTATPIRTAKKEEKYLGTIFSDNICYSVDLDTLIDNGILSKPILREFDTNVKIKKDLSKSDIKAIERLTNLPENIAKEIALNNERNKFIVNEYIRKKDEYGKCLVFAININHAIVLNTLFREENIKSDYVVSSIKDMYSGVSISNEENMEKIKDFKNNKLDVLINVNILTEGTDIPNVQTVFLTRPTASKILMNQMIGRALRGTEAGGTEHAYIVSFIDEWKEKINWISPKEILQGAKIVDDSAKSREKLSETLIPIKMIEEFAQIMNEGIVLKDWGYMDNVPLGSYRFSNIDDERNEVLVFEELKEPYEQLMINLNSIFKVTKVNLGKKILNDKDLDKLYTYIKLNEFNGYDLRVGFHREDIYDILEYYNSTRKIPNFIPFEGREKYDISKLANKIIKEKQNEEEKINYLNKEWENEDIDWKTYFDNNKFRFVSEVNRVIFILLNENQGEVDVTVNPRDYKKRSLNELYRINRRYWRKLHDEVYIKYQDEEGYYTSAISDYRSKSKRYFQIDHIIPMSEGGLTEIDNLQLLTIWENCIKGDKIEKGIEKLDIDILEEAAWNSYEEENDEITKKLCEIISNKDKNNDTVSSIKLLNKKDSGKSYLLECFDMLLKMNSEDHETLYNKGEYLYRNGKYKEAIECYDKAISIEPDKRYIKSKKKALENVKRGHRINEDIIL